MSTKVAPKRRVHRYILTTRGFHRSPGCFPMAAGAAEEGEEEEEEEEG